jgi:cold shock protein
MNNNKFLTGRVKYYNRSKGYGFIKTDGSGKDYFFHYSKQINSNEIFNEGEKVSFDIGENKNGECAINVQRI